MISFQVVETFTAAPLNMVSGISDLELVVREGKTRLYPATRAGGGVLALGVGLFVAIPLVAIAAAFVYRRISGGPVMVPGSAA